MNIYFYPHTSFRDRQLDTIRHWSDGQVINPEVAVRSSGTQVSAAYANASRLKWSWKSRVPLLNIKRRPSEAPSGSVVYVWGGLMATGKFIVDLDNPWSMVAYNLRAMPLYRWVIRCILLSSRCVGIRCMSEACHQSLRMLFGDAVYDKADVHYPYMEQKVTAAPDKPLDDMSRFLFIGTQFEIKGGEALLKAFRRVYAKHGNCRLDVITHLPEQFKPLAAACDGIHIHPARFSREEIHLQFMEKADVLIHPTYADSFGMVVLEALSYGSAIIATDVYALGEMVREGENGELIPPPISNWDGVMPSAAYYDLENIKQRIHTTDTSQFEQRLEHAIGRFIEDGSWIIQARKASVRLMAERFAC